MKHFFLIFAAALLSVHAAGAAGGPDPARFSRPEPADQIATWWHWMDGSLTKDGLTKDLEAMKAQGISNATVLNIYRMIGVQNTLAIPFDSPEWYDMFRHAVEKADSLGIEIGAANCDGWSESGGPWITPETSMKMYTWRKTYAKGNGREQTIRLAQPFGKERFYRDVAVVAWRSDAPNSFVAASPKASCNGSYPLETLIKSHKYHDETRHIDLYDDFPAEILIDGNPETALTLAKDDRDVRFEFSKPFTADELHIYILVSAANFPIPVTVSVSDDGKDYRTAGTVWPKSANSLQKLRFPEATGRYWKVTVNDEFSPTTLAEIALLRHGERGLYDTVAPETVPTADKVIDLTDRMSADGTLKWNVPRGDWTIIRFGYTSNGKFNHPASPQGVGLECDKMDTTALNIHFAAFPQKLIEAAGPYTGKTFTYLLVDSWECGQQNWTAAFPEEFRKRRGYDLTPYIPVLCGEQEGGADISAAFRHDFDRTRGELVLDYYFKHLSDLCHRNGLKLYSEGIYGGNGMPPVDVLKSYEYSDVPMTEFWAQSSEYREWPIVNEPGNYGNHAIPYHVSLLYDKPVIGCEAYTGMALYSDSPIDLKLFGDRAYCEGVNKMILHSYVHQPTDMRPGVTLGIYGQTFNRNNTWFNWADGFFGEQARIQYMLQQGEAIQVVPSVRFSLPMRADGFALYRRMRRMNASPYMFYMHFPSICLFGSSPEVMVRCTKNDLHLAPIAGTRRRGRDDFEDHQLELDLLSDPKERAEHVMLVDLGRNDLGRIAEKGTVRVERLMQIERFSHVMHLTSQVSARLKGGLDAVDVLAATFPAGTVSGAPKVRAMEIIREMEDGPRGPYAGSIGWIGLDRDSVNLDMGITIRSMWIRNGRLFWQAGAGIVHDSVPENEWKEVCNKSAIMRLVLESGEGEENVSAHR